MLISVNFVRNRGNQPYTTSGLAMTPTSYFFTLHVFTSLEHYLFGRLACYSTNLTESRPRAAGFRAEKAGT